jgi:hypothetical protein
VKDWIVKEALARGRRKYFEQQVQAKESLDQQRIYIAQRYRAKVDRLIAALPDKIEQAAASGKTTAEVYRFGMKQICDFDCGWAQPRSGTFCEFLFNELYAQGLHPQCRYDERAWGLLGLGWCSWIEVDLKKII